MTYLIALPRAYSYCINKHLKPGYKYFAIKKKTYKAYLIFNVNLLTRVLNFFTFTKNILFYNNTNLPKYLYKIVSY